MLRVGTVARTRPGAPPPDAYELVRQPAKEDDGLAPERVLVTNLPPAFDDAQLRLAVRLALSESGMEDVFAACHVVRVRGVSARTGVVFLRRGGADADKAAAAIAASAPAGQRLTAGVLRSAEEVDRVCGAVTSLAARLQADVDATWRRMDVTGRAEAPRLSGHSASAHTLDAAADLVGGSRA